MGETPSDPADRLGLDAASMLTFSDAIFAFAITLLVLELRIPEIPPGEIDAVFLAALVGISPKILGLILSFFITANFWLSFHRIFSFITSLDRTLVRLVILFLFFIVLMPFPTYLLGLYGNHASVVIFYALILAAGSFMLYAIWRYASGNPGIIQAGLSTRFITYMSRRNLVTPLTFLVSVLIAMANPLLAMISWGSIVITLPLVRAEYTKTIGQHQ